MKDIVRIFEEISEAKDYAYHYGKKATLNLLDVNKMPDLSKIYFLHEITTRNTETSNNGLVVVATVFEGKFFLVKHSKYGQHYFKEQGADQSDSKYTTNIEPLLNEFNSMVTSLACQNLDVLQWSNIDVSDALDVNMDGLLCSYRIRVPNE